MGTEIKIRLTPEGEKAVDEIMRDFRSAVDRALALTNAVSIRKASRDQLEAFAAGICGPKTTQAQQPAQKTTTTETEGKTTMAAATTGTYVERREYEDGPAVLEAQVDRARGWAMLFTRHNEAVAFEPMEGPLVRVSAKELRDLADLIESVPTSSVSSAGSPSRAGAVEANPAPAGAPGAAERLAAVRLLTQSYAEEKLSFGGKSVELFVEAHIQAILAALAQYDASHEPREVLAEVQHTDETPTVQAVIDLTQSLAVRESALAGVREALGVTGTDESTIAAAKRIMGELAYAHERLGARSEDAARLAEQVWQAWEALGSVSGETVVQSAQRVAKARGEIQAEHAAVREAVLAMVSSCSVDLFCRIDKRATSHLNPASPKDLAKHPVACIEEAAKLLREQRETIKRLDRRTGTSDDLEKISDLIKTRESLRALNEKRTAELEEHEVFAARVAMAVGLDPESSLREGVLQAVQSAVTERDMLQRVNEELRGSPSLEKRVLRAREILGAGESESLTQAAQRVVDEKGAERRESMAASVQLFNAMSWTGAEEPHAPREAWAEIGEALFGVDDPRVVGLRAPVPEEPKPSSRSNAAVVEGSGEHGVWCEIHRAWVRLEGLRTYGTPEDAATLLNHISPEHRAGCSHSVQRVGPDGSPATEVATNLTPARLDAFLRAHDYLRVEPETLLEMTSSLNHYEHTLSYSPRKPANLTHLSLAPSHGADSGDGHAVEVHLPAPGMADKLREVFQKGKRLHVAIRVLP